MASRDETASAKSAPPRSSAAALSSLGASAAIAAVLLPWYTQHCRGLPWRHAPTPYHVLVAEFMLQQTQADRVAPRFSAFLAVFPNFAVLAQASAGDVLRAWSGLGYNSRALRLQQVARIVVERYAGVLPADPAELRTIAGIGPYTASAIACFAFGRQVATVDTNIKRVLGRLFARAAINTTPSERDIWQLAEQVLPPGKASEWNQALMDLGATICTARTPACGYCPLRDLCTAYQEQQRSGKPIVPVNVAQSNKKPDGPFRGSRRYYRGLVVRLLTEAAPGKALDVLALQARLREVEATYDANQLPEVVESLARDGLINKWTAGDAVFLALPESDVSHEDVT